jgi:hypothetical protein
MIDKAERCPTAAWEMEKFWYNVTKAGEVKYGTNGGRVQITRNGNGASGYDFEETSKAVRSKNR